MPQVVKCPNCEKKLAVRDELKGRTLVCPQCKNRFTAAADDPAAVPTATPSPRKAAAAATGGGAMDFLDDLGPSTAAPANRAGAASSFGAAPSAAQRSPGATARSAASRAKKQAEKTKMLYIGGGIGAALLVLILIAVASMSGPSSSGGGQATGNQNVRFGLTEQQRKHVFEEMFHAVDENGPTKKCHDIWRQLGAASNLGDSELSAILQEGLDNKWDQPAMRATQDQKQKTNRLTWIRTMNENGGKDPIISL